MSCHGICTHQSHARAVVAADVEASKVALQLLRNAQCDNPRSDNMQLISFCKSWLSIRSGRRQAKFLQLQQLSAVLAASFLVLCTCCARESASDTGSIHDNLQRSSMKDILSLARELYERDPSFLPKMSSPNILAYAEDQQLYVDRIDRLSFDSYKRPLVFMWLTDEADSRIGILVLSKGLNGRLDSGDSNHDDITLVITLQSLRDSASSKPATADRHASSPPSTHPAPVVQEMGATSFIDPKSLVAFKCDLHFTYAPPSKQKQTYYPFGVFAYSFAQAIAASGATTIQELVDKPEKVLELVQGTESKRRDLAIQHPTVAEIASHDAESDFYAGLEYTQPAVSLPAIVVLAVPLMIEDERRDFVSVDLFRISARAIDIEVHTNKLFPQRHFDRAREVKQMGYFVLALNECPPGAYRINFIVKDEASAPLASRANNAQRPELTQYRLVRDVTLLAREPADESAAGGGVTQ